MTQKPNNEPPRWGKYASAAEYYASEEWLTIVRESYESYKILLASARRVGDISATAFYEDQVKACEQQLGITPAPEAPPPSNTRQRRLF